MEQGGKIDSPSQMLPPHHHHPLERPHFRTVTVESDVDLEAVFTRCREQEEKSKETTVLSNEDRRCEQLMKILTTSRKAEVAELSSTSWSQEIPRQQYFHRTPVWSLSSPRSGKLLRMPWLAARIPGVGGSIGWPLSLSFSGRWRFSKDKACPAFEEKIQICKTPSCLLWFLAKMYKTRQQRILLHSPNAYQRRNVTAAEVLKRRCWVFPK